MKKHYRVLCKDSHGGPTYALNFYPRQGQRPLHMKLAPNCFCGVVSPFFFFTICCCFSVIRYILFLIYNLSCCPLQLDNKTIKDLLNVNLVPLFDSSSIVC